MTLQEFYERCPATLSRPADVWVIGGMLWRGWIDVHHDLDFCVTGVYKRPELIKEITKLFPSVHFETYCNSPWKDTAAALLYAKGVKVSTCPTCPAHKKSLEERIEALEKKVGI